MAFKHKFSYEEKVKIVSEYINGTSYQQARNYTVKYEVKGVEALRDNRGKRKSLDTMTELEKLRTEVKILRAEMEVAFLKKLDEIKRRRG